jgi:hypothetical protein
MNSGRPPAQLEEVGPAVLRDVLGHFKEPVSAAALGVDHALGSTLPIELGHLLDQIVVLIVVLQKDQTSGPTVSENSSLAAGIPASVLVRGGWVLI